MQELLKVLPALKNYMWIILNHYTTTQYNWYTLLLTKLIILFEKSRDAESFWEGPEKDQIVTSPAN